ncbi:MAG: MaoC/PaaZ C-terminal domain-containing protein [Rhodospirillaceae bacterium]
MPIRAAAVGFEIGPYESELTARRALAYAATLGETADIHFSDAREGGIIAPPMMVIPIEWPASRDLRETEAFGLGEDERRRVVHAGQDTRIFQPLRPGIKLRLKGTLVSAERIKPGTKTVSRLDIVDDAGKPVATSYATAIYRGVGLDGDDTVIDAPPPWPDLAPAQAWTDKTVPIARELPHLYTECADIWNPIHTERAYALKSGLPDIILHGTCTLALAVKEVVAGPLAGDPLRLTRYACRFSGMVIPGGAITVRHADAGDGAHFEVMDDGGNRVISDGRALFGA